MKPRYWCTLFKKVQLTWKRPCVDFSITVSKEVKRPGNRVDTVVHIVVHRWVPVWKGDGGVDKSQFVLEPGNIKPVIRA